MNQLPFALEFLLLLAVAAVAFAAGWWAGVRSRRWVLPLVVAGVLLLGIKLICLRIPVYRIIPWCGGLGIDLLQSLGVVFLGVTWGRARGRGRRLAAPVLLLFLGYMFFDAAYLAVRGPELASLDGRTRQGVVLQSTPWTCFPAATATILRYWGITVSEGRVARLARTTPRGTQPYGIIYAVETLGRSAGLHAAFRHVNRSELRAGSPPCILYVVARATGSGHTIAYLGRVGDVLFIGDPHSGRRRVTWTELDRDFHWDGWVLTVTAPAGSPSHPLLPPPPPARPVTGSPIVAGLSVTPLSAESGMQIPDMLRPKKSKNIHIR